MSKATENENVCVWKWARRFCGRRCVGMFVRMFDEDDADDGDDGAVLVPVPSSWISVRINTAFCGASHNAKARKETYATVKCLDIHTHARICSIN